jgi:hypothetical protein
MKRTLLLMISIFAMASTPNMLHAKSTKIEAAKRLVLDSSEAVRKNVPSLALLSLGFFLTDRSKEKAKTLTWAKHYAFQTYLKEASVPLVTFVLR